MKPVSFILAISLCANVLAATHLGGDLTTAVLEPSGNPYFAEQDVVVPAGKMVTIKAGCVLLFKNFTGLRVDGTLTVDGASGKPVVFTSVNDGDYNPNSEQLPNSFDWNGIIVNRDCSATLKNFVLKYSVYGIKSQNPGVQIENGLFNQNGQFHFTINDKVQDVKDNLPFSFNTAKTAAADQETKSSTGTPQTSEKKNSTGKIALRYTCLGVGLIGAGVGVVYAIQAAASNKKWNDIAAQQPNDGGVAFNNAKSQYNQNLAISIITGSIGVLGLVGFGITFAF
jgi:hypothetical protein